MKEDSRNVGLDSMNGQGQRLPGKLLNVREVAEFLHVHPNTVRQWSDSGLIRSFRVGPRGDRRFNLADVTGSIATGLPIKSPNVLIVDDHRAVRQLLEDTVTIHGCAVTVVGTGEKALDELGKSHFDLVFLDLMLPGLSGLDVLRSIRANHRDTAVAVVTGYAEAPIAMEALSLGPVFFIRKPFKMADIAEVLDKTMLVGR